MQRIEKASENNSAVEKELKELQKVTGDVFPPIEGSKLDHFRTQLENIGGVVFICSSQDDCKKQFLQFCEKHNVSDIYIPDNSLQHFVENSEVKLGEFKTEDGGSVLTDCECLIARTGSVMMSSNVAGGRKVLSFAEKQLIFANENQLVDEIEDGLGLLKDKYTEFPSQVTNITGQSRTADIEKTLIMGAHGPKLLAVFIVKE